MSEQPLCRCGKAAEPEPEYSGLCYDCYAEAWDRGFSGTSEWAEKLFGEDADEGGDEEP